MTLRGLVTSLALITGALLAIASPASAAPAGWDAGNIMSDAVFTNNLSMSPSQIQEFLNSKVATCDTNGQRISEYGGPDLNGDGQVQRWEWGQASYGQTTFPCLKDVRVADGRTAAQVIYDTALKHHINPKVLIVLLQKEQGLVTDTWPLSIQYRSATGYGCPDTAPCNSDYYWLDNQLDWSAKMFRSIMNATPTWYTPYLVGNNYIQYNPDGSCGGSWVTIANRATQALYNYTPYQPNEAALGASMGATVPCGAYGNINFYRYFTQWFGPTQGGDAISYDLQLASAITLSPANPRPGDTVTVTYSVKNISQKTVSWDMDVVQCRNVGAGVIASCDPAAGASSSISPGVTIVRSFTVLPSLQGDLVVVPFYKAGGIWYRLALADNGTNSLTTPLAGLSTSAQLSISPKVPNVGEVMTYTISIQNPYNSSITIDNTILQCRYEVSTNCDSSMGGAETIPARGYKTYTFAIPANNAGNYRIMPYYRYKGVWYQYIGSDSYLQVVTTNVGLTAAPQVTPANPVPNEPFAVSYTVRNNGTTSVDISRYITQCRLNGSSNCDPSLEAATTLAPGATLLVSNTFTAKQGTYKFIPFYATNDDWHTYPSMPPTTLIVAPYVADMRITSPITTNNPIPGEPLTTTYSVKNFGLKTAYYERGLLQCRYSTTTLCDSADYGAISIAAGETKVFNDTLVTQTRSGIYRLVAYYRQNNTWYQYKGIDGITPYPASYITVSPYTPSVKLTGAMTASPTNPTLGQTVTVSYTVINSDTHPITMDYSITQCRNNTTINCDPAVGSKFTLQPGATKDFSNTFTLSRTGSYRFVPYFNYDGKWYQYTMPDTSPAIIYLTAS